MRFGNAPENASPTCTGYIGQVKELARKESGNVTQEVVECLQKLVPMTWLHHSGLDRLVVATGHPGRIKFQLCTSLKSCFIQALRC
eukprot:CAMPEP_0202483616 /NCGR_PEP_ID=MMETSP1361-20130828/2840_1 /ASSEMBLY_ACC=CAM_ASM_000849 /TAXON_ID=210615 /ORGANISM="Staurosira complex sp., Strain CCMP2646" /LENGTH=85 /DNA_ID=CAMNT_0049111953 /DNA_START=173 /DNA_END=430 /DNA_ORIENTATION=-